MLSKDVKLDSIKFGAFKISDVGIKSVYMSHEDKPLIIQTPKMVATFGLNKYNPGGIVAEVDPDFVEKYSLNLSMRNINTNFAMGYFHNLIKGIDAITVAEGVENSKSWFKKQHSVAVLTELYSSTIMFPKDKETGDITDKYPPTFRISIPVKNGKIICDCVDENDVKLELTTIPKGSEVTAILMNKGLWFTGSKFGHKWTVNKLRVIIKTNELKAFAFKDSLSDDEPLDVKKEKEEEEDEE
jgi:hypothetical protein